MSILNRLLETYNVTFVPVYDRSRGEVVTFTSESTIKGHELSESLVRAMRHRERLDKSIKAMAHILESGETTKEREERLKWEQENPEAFARSEGWYLIQEIRALTGNPPIVSNIDENVWGFGNFIEGMSGNIVKPEPQVFKHIWPRFKPSGFYWADHFRLAGTWEEAAKIAADAREKELREKYK